MPLARKASSRPVPTVQMRKRPGALGLPGHHCSEARGPVGINEEGRKEADAGGATEKTEMKETPYPQAISPGSSPRCCGTSGSPLGSGAAALPMRVQRLREAVGRAQGHTAIPGPTSPGQWLS